MSGFLHHPSNSAAGSPEQCVPLAFHVAAVPTPATPRAVRRYPAHRPPLPTSLAECHRVIEYQKDQLVALHAKVDALERQVTLVRVRLHATFLRAVPLADGT